MNVTTCRACFGGSGSQFYAVRLAPLLNSRAMAQFSRQNFSWRGGRAVDCAGLENRKAERPREFESHPLRFFLRKHT
jgi:hypothetical protein